MKTIWKGQDDLYYNIRITDTESNTALYPDDLADFRIRVYTKDVSDYVEYGKEDIYDDVLYISAQDLEQLADGPVRMQFFVGFDNDRYADTEQNNAPVRQTGYFLRTQK